MAYELYDTGKIGKVFTRLAAWRDNARLMMIRSLPEDEPRWKNEYDNYAHLCGLLIEAGMKTYTRSEFIAEAVRRGELVLDE